MTVNGDGWIMDGWTDDRRRTDGLFVFPSV